jgi:hypothetical protein
MSNMDLLQRQCWQFLQDPRYLLYRLPHLCVGLTAIIPLQHRALIGEFADDKASGQFTAFGHILMDSVLCHTQDGIFGKWGREPTFELAVMAEIR